MRRLSVLAFAFALIASPALADDESTPLLTSDDLDQLALVGIGPETIKIVNKEVRSTGKPNGYFATKNEYTNYVLKFDWMYERPEGFKDGDKFDGNSGVLLNIVAPHKVWPKCIEAQLAYNEAGHVFAINGAKFVGKTDRDALKAAMKPVGQWNEMEISCNAGKIVCMLNGKKVAEGTGADPAGGSIGWQSEGGPMRFRFLRIKKLD